MKKAMFGAGCFWGVEYNFSKLEGVSEVVSGYSGGKTSNPTYEQVCSNSTEHAEVVMINYDETVISYEDLLESFWKKHDPTNLVFLIIVGCFCPDVPKLIFFFDTAQIT